MNSGILKYFLIIAVLLFKNAVSQYEEEDEDGEDDSEGEVNVASTTKKIDPILNMNFTEQFQMLTSQVDAADKIVTTTNSTNTTVTFTTRRPRPRPTSRVEQIGSSVNGILNNVGALNIPGIVGNALSIREDNEEVREFVVGIMQAIFCSPILNNFSSCGQRLGTKKPAKAKPTKKPTEPTKATSTPTLNVTRIAN